MANDTQSSSIFLYNPTFALAIVFAVLYLIPLSIQFWQTILKYKAWYFVVVVTGAVLEVSGYVVRAVATKNLSSIVRTEVPFSRQLLILNSFWNSFCSLTTLIGGTYSVFRSVPTTDKMFTLTAPIYNPIFVHNPSPAVHWCRQLPPHLSSLHQSPPSLHNTHPSNSGSEPNPDLHHLRYLFLLGPSIR